MKYLVNNRQGQVLAWNDLTAREIRERILAADVCISDLDDTDAPSPAKKIALRAVGTIHLDPRYLFWAGLTVMLYAAAGKAAESAGWRLYQWLFLRDKETLTSLAERFDPLTVCRSLYPGVQELYDTLPMQKVYITKNAATIVGCYTSVLGISLFYPHADDKGLAIDRHLRDHPAHRRFFVRGDSEEDAVMLDRLRFYQRRGRVDDVIGCYVTPARLNPHFEINVSRDQRALVDMLKET